MLNTQDVLILGFIIYVLIEIIMIIKKVPIKRNLLTSVFLLYIVCLVSIVFFPLPYKSQGYDLNYNFIPFNTIKEYILNDENYSIRSIVGNVLLLIPWGIMFKIVFLKSDTKTFWCSTVAFCVSIEATQHIINLLIGYRYRCVDIDDFILNITGAIIGSVLYSLLFKKIFKNNINCK